MGFNSGKKGTLLGRALGHFKFSLIGLKRIFFTNIQTSPGIAECERQKYVSKALEAPPRTLSLKPKGFLVRHRNEAAAALALAQGKQTTIYPLALRHDLRVTTGLLWGLL